MMQMPTGEERSKEELRAQTIEAHFESVKIDANIVSIAKTSVADHNAIKGTNLCLASVVNAGSKIDVVGDLYHLTLLVEEYIAKQQDGNSRKKRKKNMVIMEKMVWAGRSQECICFYTPRFNYSLHFNTDYQFEFDFNNQKPPPPRPKDNKIKRLAEFALDDLNDWLDQGYGLELKDSENVTITLQNWGFKFYPKGAEGYSMFNMFLFDLKMLVENSDIPIPDNLMVVTKRWVQSLDDEKADSFLYNLSLPRHHPTIDRTLTQTIATRSLLEVSLKSPRVETAVWFAIEDELFKRNKEIEFVQVVSASATACSGTVFNLTIEARDQGVLKRFYTRVWEQKWLDRLITTPFVEITTPSETLVNSSMGPNDQFTCEGSVTSSAGKYV